MLYTKELDAALVAVQQAASLCRDVLGSTDPNTLQKGDRSPVTVADFGSQALVCRTLQQAFPDDRVIGEESADTLRGEEHALVRERVALHVRRQVPGATDDEVLAWIDRGAYRDAADRVWTVDPIDGTKGFLRGDQYAVALALLVNGEPVVACLACPNLPVALGKNPGEGVVLWAVRGEGSRMATCGDLAEASQVRVSTTADGSRARFCESFESAHSSHSDAARVADVLGIVESPIRMDSQAKYGIVARGDADIYMRLPSGRRYVENIWDHAAGCLIVEEAGGRVSDVDGRPLDFSHGRGLVKNRGVIVSNGAMHDAVIEALADVGVAQG